MSPPDTPTGIPIANLLGLPGIALVRAAAGELNRRQARAAHQGAEVQRRRAKNKQARASRRTNRGRK